MTDPKRLVELFDGAFIDPDKLVKFTITSCWAAHSKRLMGYQATMFPIFSKAPAMPIGPRRSLDSNPGEPIPDGMEETLRNLAQKDIEIFAYSAGYKIYHRDTAVLEIDQYCKAQAALHRGLRKET